MELRFAFICDAVEVGLICLCEAESWLLNMAWSAGWTTKQTADKQTCCRAVGSFHIKNGQVGFWMPCARN